MQRPAAQRRRDEGLTRLRLLRRWIVAITLSAIGLLSGALSHALPGRTTTSSATNPAPPSATNPAPSSSPTSNTNTTTATPPSSTTTATPSSTSAVPGAAPALQAPAAAPTTTDPPQPVQIQSGGS